MISDTSRRTRGAAREALTKARAITHAALLGTLVLSAGCAMTPGTSIHQPISVRPVPMQAPPVANGAIFQAAPDQIIAARYVPLFEDRRARNVGDTLVVAINEKTNASKRSNSSASRANDLAFAAPTITGLPLGGVLRNAGLEASASNTFNGKGESASNNDFTGTITVTVIEVLANGNLLVSGEKQIGINQGAEFIRFSGVVNPATVSGNIVPSTVVADARIEYRANGYIDQAQVMGWLSRFFLSSLPF